MSELKTNQIATNDGNNVAIDNSLNLKSYTTTQRDALTSAAGDIIYNSTENKPQFYNGSEWGNFTPVTFKKLLPDIVIGTEGAPSEGFIPDITGCLPLTTIAGALCINDSDTEDLNPDKFVLIMLVDLVCPTFLLSRNGSPVPKKIGVIVPVITLYPVLILSG